MNTRKPKIKLALILLIVLSSITLYAQNSVCMLDTLPSSLPTSNNIVKVMEDNMGNMYIGGYYHSSQGGNYTGGSMNFFLSKYNASKQLVWEHKIDASTHLPYYGYWGSYLTGFDLDEAGNIYVTGSLVSRVLKLDTITIAFTDNPNILADSYRHIFVAKFNASGDIQWLNYSDFINNGNQYGFTADLKYVDDNNIHISMVGKSDFHFSDGIFRKIGGDIALFTLNSTGGFIRSHSAIENINTQNIENGMPSYWHTRKEFAIRPKIIASNTKKIYLTTFYKNNGFINNQPLTAYQRPGYSNSLLSNIVMSLDSLGWSNSFRGMGSVYQNSDYHPTPFANDNYDNIFLSVGWINHLIVIDTNILPSAEFGAAVAKYDKHGNRLWYSINSKCKIYDLYTDRNNRLIVVGEYEDSLRVTSPLGTHQTLIASNTHKAVFAYSLAEDGSILWMTDIHSTNFDADYKGSYVNDCGTLTLIAKSNGNTFMGNASLINNANNVVIAKYAPNGNCSSTNCKYIYLNPPSVSYSNCNYQNISIHWVTKNVSMIKLLYSLDNGATYSPIISSFPTSLGTFSWSPPANIENNIIIIKVMGTGADSIYQNTIELPKNRLGGIRTIGGANPDYASLRDATIDMQRRGICSNLVFNIRNGNYFEQLEIKPYPGMDNYNVTIKAGSSANSNVVIYEGINSSYYQGFIKAYGIKNMTFKNIRFENNNNNDYLTFVSSKDSIGEFCENILIDSCSFHGFNFYGKNLTISNSNFYSRTYDPGYNSITGLNNDTVGNQFKILNNNFYDETFLQLKSISNVVIHNNIFRNDANIDLSNCYDRIKIYNNRAISIDKNWIYSSGSNNEITVYNNFIISSNSSSKSLISVHQAKELNIINNSFKGQNNPLIETENVADKTIMNNILVLAGNSYTIKMEGSNNNTTICNYNNYSASSIIKYNGVEYTSLSDWQSNSSFDVNSTNLNPMYENDTNLRVHNVALENIGTPISYIIYDIDGDLRSPFTPDIGADEFSLTSIGQANNILNIKVFPNPAKDIINLVFDDKSILIESIAIYNSQGKLVKSINDAQDNMQNKTVKIDIYNLSSGIYILHIVSKKGSVSKPFSVIKY